MADPFARLRASTPARIGLGRAGAGLPTRALLEFQAAHAAARDAVAAELDAPALAAALGEGAVVVASAAADRAQYLRRPDLGRRLAPGQDLPPPGDWDLAVVAADGLCARAAAAHVPTLVEALVPRLAGWRLAPVVVARQGRVAIGDEIGRRLGARAVLVLLGERPGLSAADSLGAYLTWDPRPGRLDSERNCVSNIRPAGLAPGLAAARIAWLLHEARRLGLSGIALKDRHTPALDLDPPPPALP